MEIKAAHQIITDDCRKNHGSDNAFEIAIRRLFAEWREVERAWPIGEGTKLHLQLLLEPACQHTWIIRRVGGAPDDPGRNETVRVCEDCGMEDRDEAH